MTPLRPRPAAGAHALLLNVGAALVLAEQLSTALPAAHAFSMFAPAPAPPATYPGPHGSRIGLWRDYGKYNAMPTTTAEAARLGWSADGDGKCVASLGIRYSQSASGPTRSKPISLYFTPAGQVAGVGTAAFDFDTGMQVGDALSQGYWKMARRLLLALLSFADCTCTRSGCFDGAREHVVFCPPHRKRVL